jgi:hypothetical protein
MQSVNWRLRALSVLLCIPAVLSGCGGSGEGRVLAEGKNVGEFEASPNPFRFDAAVARRYVITKVEVFGPGQLDGFPPDCSINACEDMPGKWPIVTISLEPPPECRGAGGDFAACVSPLQVQCAFGEESAVTRTYVWWDRDSARHRKRHSCAYFAIAHPSGSYVIAFVPHVARAPTRVSLVVQGRDAAIRLGP